MDGDGGSGIVGIEYSFGNAYEVDGVFLCREDNNPRATNVVPVGLPTDMESSEGDDGGAPLIFDNNYG